MADLMAGMKASRLVGNWVGMKVADWVDTRAYLKVG